MTWRPSGGGRSTGDLAARSRTRRQVALGLIIGGAIGNAIDRFAGAVVDFALFHLQIEKTFNWYVFNLPMATLPG